MKETRVIGPIFVERTPKHIIQMLRKIFPAGFEGRMSFMCCYKEDDAIKPAIEAALQSCGWVPRTIIHRLRNIQVPTYPLHIVRKYDTTDIDGARYLQIWPDKEVVLANVRVPQVGLRYVQVKDIPKGVHFARAFTYTPMVSSEFKRKAEAAGLIGLRFDTAEAALGDETLKPSTLRPVSWQEAGVEPWWFLNSTVQLPYVSPDCVILTDKGERYVPGSDVWRVQPYEGFHRSPELHYRAADIAAIEPFDLAIAREPFGAPFDTGLFIGSQRFFRFCRDQGYKISFCLVRIDEE